MELSKLHNNSVDKIDINGQYELEERYYKNTDIIKLDKIEIIGNITRKENSLFELCDYIDCIIKGNMILEDSISLEEVNYPYSIEYHDFIEENWLINENTLDIFAFLWENIVLEVPLQFTKVSDLSKFHGDGWKLISEDDLVTSNNPFTDLLKEIEEE